MAVSAWGIVWSAYRCDDITLFYYVSRAYIYTLQIEISGPDILVMLYYYGTASGRGKACIGYDPVPWSRYAVSLTAWYIYSGMSVIYMFFSIKVFFPEAEYDIFIQGKDKGFSKAGVFIRIGEDSCGTDEQYK